MYPNGIPIVVTPMLTPFVVRAEPTSNTESKKPKPMVEKIALKIARIIKKPITVINVFFISAWVG